MPDIRSFSEVKILIVGDVMLDSYIWGEVTRISPEAPIPIVTIGKRSECLGGAGNVSANLAGLGCKVTVIGVCGKDVAGSSLERIFDKKKIVSRLCRNVSGYPTITKTRIIAGGQQLIRLDEEKIISCNEFLKREILKKFEQEIGNHDLVIISDYGKGLFKTPGLCRTIIEKCRRIDIPVFVDPKSRNWEIYRQASCITPNYAEFKLVVDGLNKKGKNKDIDAAIHIRREYKFDWLVITKGAKGIMVIDDNDDIIEIPSVAREVFDVSGAGDTVIATLAAGFAAGLNFQDASGLANTAAGIVVGKVGTQPISLDELVLSSWIPDHGTVFSDVAIDSHTSKTHIRTLRGAEMHGKIMSRDAALFMIRTWRSSGDKIVFTNGCFDLLHPGHIHLIRQAKSFGDRLIVGINSDASVKRLKGATRPILGQKDRSIILSALASVDMVVIFDEDTPLELIKALQPDVLVKGSDYTPDTVVGRDIVESYGGRVCIVSMLDNYSTTGITEKIDKDVK